jgi:zinc/manganese transport system substrate-binding protein
MRPRPVVCALVAGALIAGAVAGCSAATGSSAPDRPTVTVTTNILGDVVGEIIGDQADVVVLMPVGGDPHSFAVSARDAARMRSSDLLVSNGLGLEEGIAAPVAAAAADGVPQLIAGDHADPLSFAADDSTGLPDPHFWTDPDRVALVVDALDEALSGIDGIDAEKVAQRAAKYHAELVALAADMETSFATIPPAHRALVTNHHVFGYLADRFGFEVVGAVIPSGTTLAAPSAADLADLAAAIRHSGVPAIFADSSQPGRLAQVVADETGLDIEVVALFTESLSPPGEGAETYLDMMRTNTSRITAALSR